MCECGCSERLGLVRFPAMKARTWYVIEVYPGCTDCGTHWGLAVVLADEQEEFGEILIRETPVGEFDQYSQWAARILDTTVLRQLYKAELWQDDEDSPDAFAFDEFVNRGGLIDAFHKTRNGADA